ncbi:hypothetical protein CRE_25110 [Caenorhabditis remanei]|uniref:Uncharacterized protein n=1 Tax=Caenorhabditis remanei TaxID=31234 RepID=E3LSY8_CAERE|nr:hypothetical protein CRE_25110 [Caenorhabditis remanei]
MKAFEDGNKKSMEKSVENDYQYLSTDPRQLVRLALIRVYFMQNFFTSFELATDKTLMALRNKFSFYVFASPYDVIWNRPKCELMKRPLAPNMFRQILTPNQKNLTLGELFNETNTEGLESVNIYIFIKDMDDTFTADEVSHKHKSWKYHQVIEE